MLKTEIFGTDMKQSDIFCCNCKQGKATFSFQSRLLGKIRVLNTSSTALQVVRIYELQRHKCCDMRHCDTVMVSGCNEVRLACKSLEKYVMV